MRWAFEQQQVRGSARFVLVAMADCVNGHGLEVWPSAPRLALRTGLDHRTVVASVKALQAARLIEPTGARRGLGGTPVFRLCIPAGWASSTESEPPQAELELGEESPPKNEGTSENATVGSPPNFAGTSEGAVSTHQPAESAGSPPIFEGTSEPKKAEVPSFLGVESIDIEKGEEKKERKRNSAPARPKTALVEVPGVQPQVLADYLQVRKDKRAGALTATALAGIAREAVKAGISVAQAIQCCAEWSWVGFNAAWYAQRTGGGTTPAPRGGSSPPRAVSAADRRAKTIAGLTNPHPQATGGRQHHDDRTIDVFATVIDGSGGDEDDQH